jgi:hypothetical protein
MADLGARVLDARRLALLEHHRPSRALRTMPRPLPPVSRDTINGEPLRQPLGHDPRTIKVELRTLDTWSTKHEPGPIDFIWADIQGAEGDLVAGGRETLARTKYVYTECFDDELYEGAPTRVALLDMLPRIRGGQTLRGRHPAAQRGPDLAVIVRATARCLVTIDSRPSNTTKARMDLTSIGMVHPRRSATPRTVTSSARAPRTEQDAQVGAVDRPAAIKVGTGAAP